jgi:hypothetical protein
MGGSKSRFGRQQQPDKTNEGTKRRYQPIITKTPKAATFTFIYIYTHTHTHGHRYNYHKLTAVDMLLITKKQGLVHATHNQYIYDNIDIYIYKKR